MDDFLHTKSNFASKDKEVVDSIDTTNKEQIRNSPVDDAV